MQQPGLGERLLVLLAGCYVTAGADESGCGRHSDVCTVYAINFRSLNVCEALMCKNALSVIIIGPFSVKALICKKSLWPLSVSPYL